MRKGLWLMLCSFLAFVPIVAKAELTGDTKLACEAILCLSSGTRPSECAASLARYFGFDGKDAFKDRRNFLELCPSSTAPNMPSLISAIVRAAGSCDVARLNSRRKTVTVPITGADCDGSVWQNSFNSNCGYKTVEVIDNSFPQACATYYSHIYVKDGTTKPVYVGDPVDGGHWE